MSFAVEGCRFDKCGWQTGSYGLMDLRSFNDPTAYDQVDKAVFRNCTFSRDNDVRQDSVGQSFQCTLH